MTRLGKILVYILVLLLGVLLFQNYLLRRNVKTAIEQNGTLPPGVQQQARDYKRKRNKQSNW